MKSALELRAVSSIAAQKLQEATDTELCLLVEQAGNEGKYSFNKKYVKYYDGQFYPSDRVIAELRKLGYTVLTDISVAHFTIDVKWR